MAFIENVVMTHRRPAPQPKLRTAEEIAANEDDRVIKRAEIRRKIAKAQVALLRHAELGEAIERVNQEKERLAAEHAQAAAQIQASLAAIETAQIAALQNRLPLPDDGDRRDLLNALHELNANLETAILAQDRLLSKLEQDRTATARQCNIQTLETDLLQCGRPDLVVRMKVCQSAERWAVARQESGVKQIKDFGHTAYLDAELEAADIALEAARAATAEAYRVVIEE